MAQPVPDAQGRLLSETTGLWFSIAPEGQDLWLIDAATGERLLTPSEIRASWRAAEDRAAAAEAELERLRRELGLFGKRQPLSWAANLLGLLRTCRAARMA